MEIRQKDRSRVFGTFLHLISTYKHLPEIMIYVYLFICICVYIYIDVSLFAYITYVNNEGFYTHSVSLHLLYTYTVLLDLRL